MLNSFNAMLAVASIVLLLYVAFSGVVRHSAKAIKPQVVMMYGMH